jgi:hypothetical protein
MGFKSLISAKIIGECAPLRRLRRLREDILSTLDTLAPAHLAAVRLISTGAPWFRKPMLARLRRPNAQTASD